MIVSSEIQRNPRHDRPVRDVRAGRRFVLELAEAVILVIEIPVRRVLNGQAGYTYPFRQAITDGNIGQREEATDPNPITVRVK